MLLELLGVDSICGLDPDLMGIYFMNLTTHCRFAACSTTLSQGLNLIRGHKYTSFYVFSLPHLGEKFFVHSIIFDFVCRLDHDDSFDEAMKLRKNIRQKKMLYYILTNSVNKTQLDLIKIVSRVFGRTSRYRVAGILSRMQKSLARFFS